MRSTKPGVTRLLRSLNPADWRCLRGVPAIFLVSRDNHYSVNDLQFERDPGEELEVGANSKLARAIIGLLGIALIAISLVSTDSLVIRPQEPPVTPPIEPPVTLIMLARPRGFEALIPRLGKRSSFICCFIIH